MESGALSLGLHRLSRRRVGGRALILAYHNVVIAPDDAGADASLHLPADAFRAHLEALVRTHDVVCLEALLGDRDAASPSARPRVAITFDDAYAGAIEHAVPLLAEQGLPATVFVPPGCLGGQSFWWDRYALTGRAAAEFRRMALEEAGGRSNDVDRLALTRGLRHVDPPAASLSAHAERLDAALSAHPGLTVGAHSWSHASLVACDDNALSRELTEPRTWLRDRYGDRALPVVSYPYGIADGRVHGAAERAGYRQGLAIAGGWLHAASDPFEIPRLNVPAGLTASGFRLRIDGALGT